MTSTRVLHVIDQLSDGGSQRWVWDLVRLSDRSVTHRVVPLMLDRGNFVYADRMAALGVYRHSLLRSMLRRAQQPLGNISSAPRNAAHRRALAFMWRVGCYVRASVVLPSVVARFRPDVIHVHTFESLLAGLALKKVFRIPLIHTVPCLFSQMEEIGGSWMIEAYKEHHRDIDLFFTGASRTELQSIGTPQDKVRFIDGVVNVAEIDHTLRQRDRWRVDVRAEIGAPADSLIVLSVGRLHPSKGHRYALEALPELLKHKPSVHWIVLGIGEQLSELQQRAAELGVADRVHLLGFKDDPLPYYAAADLYLRTPVYEAENLCSYQAMVAGLPVVGFDTGSDTELIRTVKHGFLVVNRDVSALAARAAEILSSESLRETLGNRGAAYARAELDIRRTIESFTAAYLALRGKRSGRHLIAAAGPDSKKEFR